MGSEACRVGPTTDLLGESPLWSVADRAFYWVDIRGRWIRRWQPEANRMDSWQTPSLVGCIAPRRAGGLIVGLQDGISFFSTETGTLTPAFSLPGLTADQRLNDGKCDAAGRFWVGSMNIVSREPDGNLYCVEPDGRVRTVLSDLAVPNCLSWSVDAGTLYFSQTRDRRILAYPFDLKSGALGEPVHLHDVPAPGTPDGATVDAGGQLWFAEYGNGRLTCLSADGAIAGAMDLPCRYPTSCAFGGERMETLFVTSGSLAWSEAERGDHPEDGGAYVVRPGVVGRVPDSFAG